LGSHSVVVASNCGYGFGMISAAAAAAASADSDNAYSNCCVQGLFIWI